MNALGVLLKPIPNGWAIQLSDGREIARFTGLGAKRRALRYLGAIGLEVTLLIMLTTLLAGGILLARARVTYASDVVTAAASERSEASQ